MVQNATDWLPRVAKMFRTAGLQQSRSCMGCRPTPFTHTHTHESKKREREGVKERSDTITMYLLDASGVPTH
jgi:hypothetical protein